MLFDKEFTTNLHPVRVPQNKVWISLGDGKEILQKQSYNVSEKASANSEAIVLNKKNSDKIESGDLIYNSDHWLPVQAIKENFAIVKIEDVEKQIPFAECCKEISIRILLCATDSIFLHIMPVKGSDTLEYLAKKMFKKFSIKTSKSNWYYLGKLCNITDTIEAIHVKPNEKLSCISLKHDLKTFKRFKQLDEGRGWYMSRTSPDAISFVPSVTINLFGFGMYYTREGPNTYTLKYDVLVGEETKKTDTVVVTKPEDSAVIGPIWFSEDHDFILVPGGSKITVVAKYPEYDESSRLIVGTSGEDYDDLDENESGLFKVEESSISANGTDVHAGQIPELYYSVEGRA